VSKLVAMPAGFRDQGALKDSAGPLWFRTTLFGVAFWLCAEVSRHISIPIPSYVAFWLPAGLYVAVLLLNPTRTWPWFMLAALCADAALDLPQASSFGAFVGFYLADTIGAVAGAWLMRRFIAEQPGLDTLKEFLGLVIFASGIGAMAGAIVGASTLVWAGINPSFFTGWKTWAVNTGLATLLMTPLVIAWSRPAMNWKQVFNGPERVIEAAGLFLALSGYTYYLLVIDNGIEVPYKSRLMPILLWIGTRFGLRGITAVNLWFAIWITFLTTHYQKGLTHEQIISGSYLSVLQSFLATSVLIALVPTVVLVERNQHQQRLEDSEHRFRRLFDTAADALFVFDDQGNILDVNDAACKSHGYSREEMLKLKVPDIKGKLDPGETEELWKRIQSKSFFKVENFHRRKDGSLFPVEISVSPLDSQGRRTCLAAVRDISDRKKAEEALRSSDERFRLLWDESADGIRLTNADGTVIMANPAYCRLMNLPIEAVEGRPISDVYLAEKRPESLALHQARFVSQSQPPRIETQVTLWNGDTRWVEVSYSFLRQSGVEPLLLAMFRDTTGRKRAELALLAEKKLSDTIINAMPGAFYMFDRDGNIVRWNDELAKITGANSGELAGFTLLSRIVEADRENVRTAVSQAYQHGTAGVEARANTTDGIRWFHFVGRRLQMDGQVFMVGMGFDITERKQAEATVLLHEAALKQANDGIALVGVDGLFKFVNDAWARMHGFEKGELIGQSLALVHTKEQLADCAILNELAYSSGYGLREVGHKRKNGTTFPTLTGVTLMKDATGQVIGLIDITSDLSAQKQMEAQFLRAQRQQTIGTIASGIAHDLNNILSPMLAGIPILREEIARKDTQQLLDLMESSIQRGADIVRQLLIYGRGGHTQRLPLSMLRQIQEVAKIITETFPKNIRLETSWPPGPWSIVADPTQIYQVLLNLAVNARDALPNGGTITIASQNVTLDLTQVAASPRAKPGDYVLLRVADTGTGMPPDVLDHIFEPFFTTKEIGKGTGLGLAVVIGVVENHGGFITVHSEVGKGTEFKIYFPAVPARTETPPAAIKSSLPRGHGELILLVDDEPAILKVTSKILGKHGYESIMAENGVEALEAYAKNAPAVKVVITDLSMPGMDGLTLAATLLNSYPEVNIIITSGLGDTLDPAKLTALGVKDILKKPFTTESILNALRQILAPGSDMGPGS
jgi:PAS domain S-box-containing protein